MGSGAAAHANFGHRIKMIVEPDGILNPIIAGIDESSRAGLPGTYRSRIRNISDVQRLDVEIVGSCDVIEIKQPIDAKRIVARIVLLVLHKEIAVVPGLSPKLMSGGVQVVKRRSHPGHI